MMTWKTGESEHCVDGKNQQKCNLFASHCHSGRPAILFLIPYLSRFLSPFHHGTINILKKIANSMVACHATIG